MDTIDLSNLGLAEKEQKILESAIKIFSEKGFSAATTSEIARNAGVAEGTIFRYFKTKKDILTSILVNMINLCSKKIVISPLEKLLVDSDEISDNMDVKETLRNLFYDRYNLVLSIFPMARIVATEALYHEDIRNALYENIINPAIKLFEKYHKQLAKKGLLRDDIEPFVLFRSIFSNIALFIMKNKFFEDKLGSNNIDEELDKMLDVILYGISGNRSSENMC